MEEAFARLGLGTRKGKGKKVGFRRLETTREAGVRRPGGTDWVQQGVLFALELDKRLKAASKGEIGREALREFWARVRMRTRERLRGGIDPDKRKRLEECWSRLDIRVEKVLEGSEKKDGGEKGEGEKGEDEKGDEGNKKYDEEDGMDLD